MFNESIAFLISLYSKDFGAIILKSFFDDWNLEYEVVLKQMQEEGINYLLHAGDLCKQESLEMISSLNIPYTCVFGNNDYSKAIKSLQV